jgi:hypothetical protein
LENFVQRMEKVNPSRIKEISSWQDKVKMKENNSQINRMLSQIR